MKNWGKPDLKPEKSKYKTEEYRKWYREYYRKNKLSLRENYNKRRKIKSEKTCHEKIKNLHPLKITKGTRPRKKEVKSCKKCSVEFYPKRDNSVYCSRECCFIASKEKSKRECIICKGVFYCTPSQLVLRSRKTCSLKCRNVLARNRAEERRDKKLLSDGQKRRIIRYSPEADKWRRSVFERDNFTCQKCGQIGGYLQAHHIKQFAYHPELRFDVNNGETVCKKCHKEIPIVKEKKPRTHSQLVKELDSWFSKFVRLRNADENGIVKCFTSGKYMHYKKAQAGHFISRRHFPTRWDEINVQVQSVHENIYNQGNGPVFSQNLAKEYGQKEVDKLLLKKNNKWSPSDFEIQILINEYKEKVRVLLKSVNP